MKKFGALLICLCCVACMAQEYVTNYKWSVTDITANATSGTNAWHSLPGQCKLGSGSEAIDLTIWCVGTDSYPYSFSRVTKTWTKHTNMGTASLQMIVRDTQNIYSMQADSGCPGGDKDVMKWNGSAWVLFSACWTTFNFAADGYIVATVNAPAPYTHTLWYAPNNSSNYTQWSPGGVSTWKYASMINKDGGCGVTEAGALYELSIPNGGVLMPAIPGTAAGCIATINDPAVLAWNTAGGVYTLDFSTDTWKSVSGLTTNQIFGVTKNTVIALDLTGKPYHWNVYAPTVTGTTSGVWGNGCPSPGDPCNPNSTHTGHLQVYFSSTHGLNYGAGEQSQTIPVTGNMNLSSYDDNPFCDQLFGDPTDGECGVSVGGFNHCNQSGQNLNSPGQVPYLWLGDSFDVQGDVGRFVVDGPVLEGTPSIGSWGGQAYDYTEDECVGGVPTCPTYIPLLVANASCAFDNPAGSLICQRIVTALLNDVEEMSPWVIITPYYKESPGPLVCSAPGPPIPYNGDTFLLPNCQ